jgi:hypothetical protein
MLNPTFESSWLVVEPWIAALALIVAASPAMGANLSTTALLLALGLAPAIVIARLARRERSAGVAQVLYAVETHDRRS